MGESQFPQDGRQSDAARRIARGTRRLLAANGWSAIDELLLPDGRRADLVALGRDGSIDIVEIKSSVADFRNDHKWPDYRAYCDRLWFALALDGPLELIPQAAGLILADAYGGEILRQGEMHRLAPARRKAMTLRFAAAAADRLATCLELMSKTPPSD